MRHQRIYGDNMLRAVTEVAGTKRCVSCSIRSKALFSDILDDDLYELVHTLKVSKSRIPSKTLLYREGDIFEKCFTLKSGWMILYKTLRSGKRQILNFFLPGDFIGYELDKEGRQLYSLETLTECSLCVFPADKLQEIMQDNNKLMQGHNKVLARKSVLYAQHLVSVGRRDSKERLAATVLDLFDRADYSLDNLSNKFMYFPPTQEELADMLGLTQVHVNRVMRGMVDNKVIQCKKKIMTILDETKLKKIANE